MANFLTFLRQTSFICNMVKIKLLPTFTFFFKLTISLLNIFSYLALIGRKPQFFLFLRTIKTKTVLRPLRPNQLKPDCFEIRA